MYSKKKMLGMGVLCFGICILATLNTEPLGSKIRLMVFGNNFNGKGCFSPEAHSSLETSKTNSGKGGFCSDNKLFTKLK